MSKPGRPGSGEPTLRDIAKATGCSLMTVSRVLGAHADLVAEPKRSHIRQVAEQLGYRPNLNIRALRRGSGTLVGLLTERFDARSHAILIGLHDTLVPQGLLPCLLVIDHQPAQPGMSAGDSAVRHLIKRRMAAILGILPDPAVAPEWLPSLTREALERGIPCLAIGATAHDYGLPMVRADLAVAARHLVDHAVDQGAKAACLVENPDSDGWQRALAAAVRSEAKRREWPCVPPPVPCPRLVKRSSPWTKVASSA